MSDPKSIAHELDMVYLEAGRERFSSYLSSSGQSPTSGKRSWHAFPKEEIDNPPLNISKRNPLIHV